MHRILHNLLIGGVNSEKKQFIYNEIATHAIPILSKFDARCLSNPRFQDDVISVLSSIGLRPEEEELTSGYFLDALIEVNDMKVGIEVDGTSHFINREATGSTLLKRRQENNLDDIRIVSVPYWEWNELGKDHAEGDIFAV